MNYKNESLLEFKNHPEKILDKIKQDGFSLLLSEDGETKFVLTPIQDFQQYVDALEYKESVEAIKESIELMKRGEGVDAIEFLHEKIKAHEARK